MTEQRGRIVEEEGNGTLEIFDLPVDTDFLLELLTDVYDNYWDQIHFGTAVQGAVWEVRAPNAPERISLHDGYLTIDFGHWHFHLCIGVHKGTGRNPASEALSQHRRTSVAQLYRNLDRDGRPVSWGLRMFNGKNEQQMTVFLPNPNLSIEQTYLKKPDLSKLEMWNHLREKYLGLPQDPLDCNHGRRVCG
ncbi:MAG: hypothetical protein OIF57_19755 [Marinobacterium sp.]|nr:hypothetical protein [Marinobacterium sp.]